MTKGAVIFYSSLLVFFAYVWAYDLVDTNREISADNSSLSIENQQLRGELARVNKVLGELAGSDEVADVLVTKIIELEKEIALRDMQLNDYRGLIGRLEANIENLNIEKVELVREIDELKKRIEDITGVEERDR